MPARHTPAVTYTMRLHAACRPSPETANRLPRRSNRGAPHQAQWRPIPDAEHSDVRHRSEPDHRHRLRTADLRMAGPAYGPVADDAAVCGWWRLRAVCDRRRARNRPEPGRGRSPANIILRGDWFCGLWRDLPPRPAAIARQTRFIGSCFIGSGFTEYCHVGCCGLPLAFARLQLERLAAWRQTRYAHTPCSA